MLNIKTMSDPLLKAASASGQFKDGTELYLKGGLLSVWYYRYNSGGKTMSDGMWCTIRGIVRDDTNHIVDITGIDSIQCSGKLCKCNVGAGTICRHAVAMLAYVAMDTTYEPMPNASNLNISTYLADYAEEDRIADHATATATVAAPEYKDIALMSLSGLGAGPAETLDEYKKRIVKMCIDDFEAVQRNSSEGVSSLRTNVKFDTEMRTFVYVFSFLNQDNAGIVKSVAKFDVSLAYLQKAILIHADTREKRRAHIRHIINMWTESNMRYVKKCLVQALVELGTSYDDLWRSDVIWYMKKNVSKITVTMQSRAGERYDAGKSKDVGNVSLSEMCSHVLHLIKQA